MPTSPSRAIASYSYAEAKADLVLVFRGSGVYVFHGVPKEIYDGLASAASKGRYFNEAIRGRFPSECVRRFRPAWNRLAKAG